VEVAQAGLAAPGLLLEGSLFWVAESDEGSGSGRCGFANECLQLTLEGEVGTHAGEPAFRWGFCGAWRVSSQEFGRRIFPPEYLIPVTT